MIPGPDLPAYIRKDKAHVSDADQRPTDLEYDRYLWLCEEAKRAGYDSATLRRSGSFQVGDVLFTAIYAAASDLLPTSPCAWANLMPPSYATTPPRPGRRFCATSTRRRAWPPTSTFAPASGCVPRRAPGSRR